MGTLDPIHRDPTATETNVERKQGRVSERAREEDGEGVRKPGWS